MLFMTPMLIKHDVKDPAVLESSLKTDLRECYKIEKCLKRYARFLECQKRGFHTVLQGACTYCGAEEM